MLVKAVAGRVVSILSKGGSFGLKPCGGGGEGVKGGGGGGIEGGFSIANLRRGEVTLVSPNVITLIVVTPSLGSSVTLFMCFNVTMLSSGGGVWVLSATSKSRFTRRITGSRFDMGSKWLGSNVEFWFVEVGGYKQKEKSTKKGRKKNKL